MTSAVEAELGRLFHNAQEVINLRTILEELGHLQPSTPIKMDNSTAEGIINKTIKQKKSRAMDMMPHRLRDRVLQKKIHYLLETSHGEQGGLLHKAPVHCAS